MLQSVLHDGRDLTDTPIELKSGEAMSDVQVIITDRVTTVSGVLADEKGSPITDGTVIVFATDAAKWSLGGGRFVRAARPDQQGGWRIRGIPPGEYLAVAVDYIEDGQWNDPEFLESVRRYAQKVTLTDGGSQAPTVDQ